MSVHRVTLSASPSLRPSVPLGRLATKVSRDHNSQLWSCVHPALLLFDDSMIMLEKQSSEGCFHDDVWEEYI